MSEDTRIRDLFQDPGSFEGQDVVLKGWIRNSRGSNKFGFIELNDGTYFTSVQIVCEA